MGTDKHLQNIYISTDIGIIYFVLNYCYLPISYCVYVVINIYTLYTT